MINRKKEIQQIFFDNKGNNLKTLIAIYQGYYGQLLLSILFFLLKHSPTWILPIVISNVINIVTDPGADASKKIFVNIIIMAVVILQNIPTNYVHTYFYAKTIRQVEKELREAMVRKLQQLSISYHKEIESGRLQSKIMRDVEQIENLSAQVFITILSIAVNVIVALAVVIFKSPLVFLFFLGTVPVAVLIMVYFRGKIKRYNSDFRKEMEETSVQVMEMVEMIPIARAHALEKNEASKLEKQLVNVADKGFRLDMIQTYFGSISWVAFQLFQVICLCFTGFMALQGKITVGDVTLYQSYFGTIVGSIANIVGLVPIVAKGLESVGSVGDVLLSREVEEKNIDKKEIEVKGKISFEQVGFQYADANHPVFSGLNFTVEPGETIAFVGSSGAGKTTILNLVIGFARATSGSVKIDGTDIKELNLQKYRNHIAVVPQNSILFRGSIRDNITYGLKEVSNQELKKVIADSNLTELIETLPEGLDTELQEHGGNLSGGQKQRISIARAFVRNPKILILDEATSALDTVSERKIQQATEKLTQDRTTLIVAHRLSTIRNADKIAVIDHGKLEEFGTYDELMEKKGAFYELRKLQL